MSEKKREVNAFGKRNPFTSIIKGLSLIHI